MWIDSSLPKYNGINRKARTIVLTPSGHEQDKKVESISRLKVKRNTSGSHPHRQTCYLLLCHQKKKIFTFFCIWWWGRRWIRVMQPTGEVERRVSTRYEEYIEGSGSRTISRLFRQTRTAAPAPNRAETSRGCGHQWNRPFLQFCAIFCML